MQITANRWTLFGSAKSVTEQFTTTTHKTPKHQTMKTPPITQLEMSDTDIEFAERIANKLHFTQTAYTSTSGLWGLFCLPDNAHHKHGCIIKTKEFGFMFVADLEDMQLHELADEERKVSK